MFAVLCDRSNFAVFAVIALTVFVSQGKIQVKSFAWFAWFNLSTKLVLASFDRFQFTMHCVD